MNDGLLSLIVFRLLSLAATSKALAELTIEARHRVELGDVEAQALLRDLEHLAAELEAIAAVLGAAHDPQSPARPCRACLGWKNGPAAEANSN